MLKYSDDLDMAFLALADPTRRAIVDRLTRGPASVSDLAAPFAFTLAAIMQHLRVLEQAGLVSSQKQGRVRTCSIEPEALRSVEDWISERRTTWERRLDRLGLLLDGPEPTTDAAADPAASVDPESGSSTSSPTSPTGERP
ncbi:metalloregulator ArsR/SmtB family transcription factor [Leifsonia sp. YIM 134122]|uniref:Metalloregulator ArsR/SmtB family transcription factor n=1 Tax=Leifsonia stereocauli TaxID=3134136 RepID=A0ABU9W2V2_9MICO